LVLVKNKIMPRRASSIIAALEIARGTVPGMSFIHKFGEAGNIDTADGFVDVWDGATDLAGLTKTSMDQYTYSTTADIDSVSSSSASDTTNLEIQGLDANWEVVTQTVTLTGQTRVALTTDLIRVFRMKNAGSDAYVGNIFCYKDGDLTTGIPDTEADIRAIIQIGNEQTLMALYTIPLGKTGFLCKWYASSSKKKDQLSDVKLLFRPSGGVFQLKHVSSIAATGASAIQHEYFVPESGLDAKTDIALRADTSKNDGSLSGGFDLILVDNTLSI